MENTQFVNQEEIYQDEMQIQQLDKPSFLQRVQRSLQLRSEKGVTLIELLAVIAILAIIAAVAIPVVSNSMNNAKVNTTEQNLQIIADALQRYDTDNSSYPAGTDISASTLNSTLNEYIQGIPNDGFGKPFQYTASGGGFTVTASNNYYISNTTSSPTSGSPDPYKLSN